MAPNNPLPIHGNEKTMNLNSLILTNIQSSPYFKVNLFELKTYHQVIDEIYYKVEHLEPWEKGSRKTAGQTGMCGGVRGVGAGGIVSSAYCLLYKLFTLKLTKKQVIGLLTHQDSTYIRALGFMYIRYTQNPADLWEWYSEYLDDEEELDVKAGGGHVMVIGEMIRQWMTKLEWYSTLFPRIPVPIQKQNEARLKEYDSTHVPRQALQVAPHDDDNGNDRQAADEQFQDDPTDGAGGFGEAERIHKLRESPGRGGSSDRRRDGRSSPPFDIAKEMDRERSHNKERRRSRSRDRERDRHHKRRSKSRDRGHRRSRSGDRSHRRSRSRDRSHRRSRSRDRHRHRRSRSRERKRSRSHDRHKNKRSRSRDRVHKESSFDRVLRREKERVKNGR